MTPATLVCPDLHYPIHDKRAVRLFLDFAQELQPSRVLQLGDSVDLSAISRWNRDLPEEYELNIQEDFDKAGLFYEELRDLCPESRIDVLRGNHDYRLEHYLHKKAPGLRRLRGLAVPDLLGLESQGITYHKDPLPLGKNWWAFHGDEVGGGKNAGATAFKLIQKVGASVVAGHCHRMGIVHETKGVKSKLSVLTGVECGHLMDVRLASYLTPAGSANWQQGFAILHEYRKGFFPELIRIESGVVLARPVYNG